MLKFFAIKLLIAAPV